MKREVGKEGMISMCESEQEEERNLDTPINLTNHIDHHTNKVLLLLLILIYSLSHTLFPFALRPNMPKLQKIIKCNQLLETIAPFHEQLI